MWPTESFKVLRSADPSLVSLLSLKLLLLAFFILLTSLAQFQDDRTRQVLESVNEAFDGRVPAERSYDEVASALDNLEAMDRLLTEVGDLFKSRLPAVRVARAADRPQVAFELPAGTLFGPAAVRLRPGRWLLLRRLVEALVADGRADLPYRLTVLHGLPPVARNEPLSEELPLQRMATVAEMLAARGLPVERLSVGLQAGSPGTVRFVLEMMPVTRKAAPGRSGTGR